MLETFRYVNHLNEEINSIEDGLIVGTNNLRDYEWDFSTQFNKISSFYRKSAKKKIPFIIYGTKEQASHIFEIFEKDVLNKKAGRIYIGEYYLRGYIVASNKRAYADGIITGDLTFIAEDSMWIKPVTYVYTMHDVSLQDGQGYAYDFPYDYSSSANVQNLHNTSFMPCSAIINIYGEIVNPALVIAGHTYKVNVTVGAGERLTIDGYNKEIYKVNSQGAKTNVFANRDTTSYIFEKVPTGEQKIAQVGTFDYDITLMLERSEPEWI